MGWKYRGGAGIPGVTNEIVGTPNPDPIKWDLSSDWRAGAAQTPGLASILAPPAEPVGGQSMGGGEMVPLTSDMASGEGALDYASTRPPAAAIGAPSESPAPEPYDPNRAKALVLESQGTGPTVDRAAVAALEKARADRAANQRTQAGREGELATKIGEHGKTAADMLTQQANELDAYAESERQRHATDAQERARLRANMETKSKEAEQAAANIDPDRLMRGGRGVLFGIGAALGAFGASLTKSPNYALEIMQSSLDRDLEAQKEGVRGKREAASFAKETYEGFLREGQTVDQAKANTQAIMSRAWASKIAAQAQGLESAQGQAEAERLKTQFTDNALAQEEAANAMKARPRGGTKRMTPAEMEAERLKLEKAGLENAQARQKLQGGDPAVKVDDAPQKRVQDKLGAIDAFQTTMDDLKSWKDQGEDYLPGAGGVRDIPDTITRKARKAVKGGTGFTPEQQRIDSSLKMAGYRAYIASAHNAPNSTPEREAAEASMLGNGETDAAMTNVGRETQKQFYEAQNEIDAMPPGRSKELFQGKLNTAKQKWDRKHSSKAEAYRSAYGKGGQ